ncbi:hypothetical protein AMECASPLE_005314, partial [Ameca splendens]
SFSPVRELRADQVLALGSVVTEMGDRELQETNLTDLGVLAHLGTLTNWTRQKMRAVVLSVLQKSRMKVEQLTVVDLATLGHLICGLHPSEIKRLSPYNLSIAVLFLRESSLPCTEQQMEALTNCLARAEAFGPVSAWGPEIFTEIGTLAAGLPDIVLSALLQEQMEGITPEAVALMSPKKMAMHLYFDGTSASFLHWTARNMGRYKHVHQVQQTGANCAYFLRLVAVFLSSATYTADAEVIKDVEKNIPSQKSF